MWELLILSSLTGVVYYKAVRNRGKMGGRTIDPPPQGFGINVIKTCSILKEQVLITVKNGDLLKYGFCKKSLQIFDQLNTFCCCTHSKMITNMLKKVFNWSEVHLLEVASYKIHTLKVASTGF